MKNLIWIFLPLVYLAFLFGCEIGFKITNFTPAKGFWRLIPFRVSGWKHHFDDKIDKINWVWE